MGMSQIMKFAKSAGFAKNAGIVTVSNAMNWRTNLDEVLSAMAQLEGGEDWVRVELEDDDPVSLGGAIRHLKKVKHGSKNTYAEVYGSGGFHRYFLYLDGSVSFSSHHTWDERVVDKARQLGFEILG